MTDRKIPSGAVNFGASPCFDQRSLPAALLADHRTAAGVFGRLVVLAGELDFVTADGAVRLAKGDTHVILPEESHHVVPREGMQFQIEFHK